MCSRLFRAFAVLAFLYVAGVVSPAPALADGCEEYMCRVPVGIGGGGFYCVQEGAFDCICNYNGCVCGYCYCIDGGDCWIMPSQG